MTTGRINQVTRNEKKFHERIESTCDGRSLPDAPFQFMYSSLHSDYNFDNSAMAALQPTTLPVRQTQFISIQRTRSPSARRVKSILTQQLGLSPRIRPFHTTLEAPDRRRRPDDRFGKSAIARPHLTSPTLSPRVASQTSVTRTSRRSRTPNDSILLSSL